MAREMKDSGIAWIGEIPREWTVQRIKYLRNSEPDSFQDGDWIESPFITNEGIRYLTTGNVGDGVFKRQGDGYITEETFNELNCKFAFPNDLVISRLNAPYGRACILPSDEEKYVLAVDIVILRTDNDKRFLCYLMQCEGYQNVVQDGAKGTTMKRISRTNLGNVCVPIAPLLEQRRIADFLDAECARIDAVIEQTRASIEEYKKLKQSVITQAVTKGIRPGRKMKDSGIEWIGEIPEEWDVVKTMRILAMPITDGPHTTPELLDSGVAFVSAEAVSCGNGKIDFSHIRGYISEAFYQECCLKYVPAIDDVYMIKSGATTGKVAIVDTLEPKFTIWSPLAVFRCNSQKMIPKYLFYELQSDGFQKQVEFGWSFGTQQNIGMRVLEQLKVSLPPIAEQQEIAAYLDEKCVRVESLIIEKQRILSELESYKKSLIFEFVTGKKEVGQSAN